MSRNCGIRNYRQSTISLVLQVPWFARSGEKITTTFTEGIKKMADKPVEAVQGALARVRKLLPFSDAKRDRYRLLPFPVGEFSKPLYRHEADCRSSVRDNEGCIAQVKRKMMYLQKGLRMRSEPWTQSEVWRRQHKHRGKQSELFCEQQ